MSELIAGTLCQAMWPDLSIYSVAASSVFSIPFWRHFVAWVGSVPASRANFVRLLRRGSVAVIVGGIAEMYMQHARRERIVLRNRKGFVRIAVEQGLDGGIIPVYHVRGEGACWWWWLLCFALLACLLLVVCCCVLTRCVKG